MSLRASLRFFLKSRASGGAATTIISIRTLGSIKILGSRTLDHSFLSSCHGDLTATKTFLEHLTTQQQMYHVNPEFNEQARFLWHVDA